MNVYLCAGLMRQHFENDDQDGADGSMFTKNGVAFPRSRALMNTPCLTVKEWAYAQQPSHEPREKEDQKRLVQKQNIQQVAFPRGYPP